MEGWGDCEGWPVFFLEGIAEVSSEATTTAREIVALREAMRARISENLGRRASSALSLLEALFDAYLRLFSERAERS